MPNLPPPRAATLTIDQLRLSPFNVRLNQVDARPTAPLKASIAAAGIEQSLAVHPMRGHKNQWGVLAGGRRYRCVRELVDEKVLPADFAVPVLIHDVEDVELVARSLDENLMRKDLRFYETCAAMVREQRLGRSAKEIATRHGQELTFVRRALRLGELAKPVFDAFAEGRISTDQAQAFGATADLALQQAAFAALMAGPEHGRTPAAIRAWLRIDDQEVAKLLRFAGDEYRAGGGAFEPDLFADGLDASGRVTDEPLLRRVADEKVQALRVRTRERVGRPDLRFVPAPPQAAHYAGPEWSLHIPLEGDAKLPEGEVVGHIAIGEDGEPEVTFWWANRAARDGKVKPAAAPKPLHAPGPVKAGAAIGHQFDDSRLKADALIKEEAGLTAEGTATLRSIRRAILRAALIKDARDGRQLGRDYLVFAQCRLLLPRDLVFGPRDAEVGMKRLTATDPDGETARAQIEASEAGKAWQGAIRDLKGEPFLTERDHAAAFLDFCNAAPATKELAAAVVAGIALERSLDAAGYECPVHDALAVQARVAHPAGIRRWWRPSPAFLRMLPRAEQLAIAEPFVERAAFGTWQRLKVDELTPLVLKVVTGASTSVRKSLAAAAAEWVHPLLRFRRDAGVRTPAAERELEAAE